VAELKLDAANGYRIVAERFDRTLTVTVSRGRAEAEYVLAADGPPGNRRIEASLPGLVEIDVGFRPRSRTTTFPEGCWFHKALHTRGVFVGRIAFEGEGGYTSVDTRRARGTYVHRVRTGCDPDRRRRASASARARTGETVELGSESRTEFESVDFNAAKGRYPLFAPYDLDPGKRRFFRAESVENGKAVDITRTVEVLGPPRSFTVDGARTRAVVMPPPPFSGSATLTQERPSFFSQPDPSWAGDLRVTFPGAPDVPLTGPGFEAHLHSTS
jgi:hypothetical protein